MRTPITPLVHAALDDTTAVVVGTLPHGPRFPQPARRSFDARRRVHRLSALTDHSLGARRTIPFAMHGASEPAIAAALPAMPWVLGLADHTAARTVRFGRTAPTRVVAARTDWSAER